MDPTTMLFMLLWSTESVRLVNGSGLCSGRVEVKSNQSWSSVCEDDFDQQDAEVVCRELGGRVEVKSNQSWSSVCEDDFDQQDAEVVCRELGCGAPSVLQGALYGEVGAPMGTKEFQKEKRFNRTTCMAD
ncbi:uncharacterized protein ACN63O_012824 [Diretmus argenteus]